MRTVPLPDALGAQVEELDLRQPLSPSVVRDLERAAAQFGVLVFHDQGLDESEQIRFTQALGDSDISHLTSAIAPSIGQPQHRGVHTGALPNTLYWTHGPGFDNNGFPDADQGFGRFHSDLSYQQDPLQYTILGALESTQTGGETEFVDTGAAYAALDDSIKQRLAGLEAVHLRKERSGKEHKAVHPVVIRNPNFEIDALYVNRSFTHSIRGLDHGDPLLEQLIASNENTPARYRHKWRNGDLVLWDNFRVLHRRCGFPSDERRVLLRTQSRRQRPAAALA
ncbi:MAG: TauD/TfdA family dioxygenase [Myxococcota bacterium]